ncbi:acetylserotonin O-methyltransferase [Nonomuraea sp. NBC_01738]|uniref:methyltransferase n=1 Tax=Nonomuraea sp. NBC_01738 TaxID=2976003 RepID=UPI002E1483A6|nr:acetylserotonin O-methyltransferase [Nonomuraea sp. NBC_01738]
MTNARDTAAGILRLGNAFCDAKALLTAVELGLFDVLHAGPATAGDLRDRLGLQGRGLSDFLQLLVELELLTEDGGRYGNANGADRFLVRELPSYVGGFLLRSNRNLYPAWGRLTEALRTGDPQAGGSFDDVIADPALLGQFVRMMDALTQIIGPELVDAVDWPSQGSVLDVGGCRGNLAAQVVKAHPELTGTVYDLPEMEPFFDEHMAATGLTGRLSFHGGNFFTDDSLPAADVVLMGHVLHDWDEVQRRDLVAKAFPAVNPGGALVVYDRMLDDRRNRVENLVISLDMLLVSTGGSEYTSAELREHAEAAGFGSITVQPLGDFDTLVVCRKD